jgi:hypothetical protein
MCGRLTSNDYLIKNSRLGLCVHFSDDKWLNYCSYIRKNARPETAMQIDLRSVQQRIESAAFSAWLLIRLTAPPNIAAGAHGVCARALRGEAS